MARLAVGIVDANNAAATAYRGVTASVIGQWLEWECGRLGIVPGDPATADVVFVAFAGSVDWRGECSRALKRHKIQTDPRRRDRKPYVIAGGPVDATPFVALGLADALVIGEGYRFVRIMLDAIAGGATVADLARLTVADRHAIERSQVEELHRDPAAPWLLARPAPLLATPDPWVDWSVPSIKSDDKVIRIIGSKGCHFKCSYCATTYRQSYAMNPDAAGVRAQVRQYHAAGERVQILSNDPANIPWYVDLSARLDHGSYTIEEFLKPENRAAILRQRPRIVRFGVEGLSERIRHAWLKPIPDATLLDVLDDLQRARINSHMFMIVAAPWEAAEDWAAWREFTGRLASVLSWGVCRIKMTSYQPSPPAPLMRFLQGAGWEAHHAEWVSWYLRNAVSRHVLLIPPRKAKSRIVDVADQCQISDADAARLVMSAGTHNLAPTLDEFRRMPSHVVDWPIPLATRFAIGEKYLDRMRSRGPLPAVATVRRVLGAARRRLRIGQRPVDGSSVAP